MNKTKAGLKCLNEYKGDLVFKRRGVYFCCHKDDFWEMFRETAKDIMDVLRNDLSPIWYYDPSEGIPEGDDFLFELSQMKLFVVLVTSRFLNENNVAREIELEIAIKNKIPILPIAMEKGLGAIFNQKYDNLEMLSYKGDLGSAFYKEKLKKYFDYFAPVANKSHYYEQIEASFESRAFLSYRKKDRMHALEVMKLIHENDFARNIAIWYDDFLVPGEVYSDAICENIEEADYFILVITPNVLEHSNYVMNIEYPKAREAGKCIIPIEVIETDRDALKRYYEGLDEDYKILKITDKEGIAAKLKEISSKEIEYSKESRSAESEYYRGLGFLHGIAVEKNYDIALEIIKSVAVEEKFGPAYRELVEMYRYGIGVERNIFTALKIQEEFMKCIIDTVDLEHGKRVEKQVLEYMERLEKELESPESMFSEITDPDEYLDKIEEMLRHEFGDEMGDLSKIKNWRKEMRPLGDILEKIGDQLVRGGEVEEAIKYYKKCVEAREEESADYKNTLVNDLVRSVCMKIGELLEKEGNFEDARKYYYRTMVRDEEAYTYNGSKPRSVYKVYKDGDLLKTYINIGDTFGEEGLWKEALEYYQKAYVLATNELKAADDSCNLQGNALVIARIRIKIGSTRECMNDKSEEALEFNKRTLELLEKMMNDSNNSEYKRACMYEMSFAIGLIRDKYIAQRKRLKYAKFLYDWVSKQEDTEIVLEIVKMIRERDKKASRMNRKKSK
ncbi:MAG: toll/interleukin-1 receptor domain-containing protein [Lachnospiraceae bacterium]|nr:toll/interleukin-1 receptor domain-containing protein [Lachnospiraceae bacterium]